MEPKNFKHVRKLWTLYDTDIWAKTQKTREWIYEDKTSLSHLEWDIEILNEPTATRLKWICDEMWEKHKIAAIWYVKASEQEGLITIVIS